MLNAVASSNFFGAYYSVLGRGQAHAVCRSREAGEAQAGAELFGVRLVCDGVDDTRPDGAAHSHAGLVG